MSDVIANAKQLLEGVTSGKWRAADSDIIAEDSNRFIATVSEYSGLDDPSEEYANVQLIAGAPELAQALAEETWEYSIQLKDHTGEWETATNSETHLEEWWEDLKYAEWAKEEEQEHGYSCRVVRRRVSPPEVINES